MQEEEDCRTGQRRGRGGDLSVLGGGTAAGGDGSDGAEDCAPFPDAPEEDAEDGQKGDR